MDSSQEVGNNSYIGELAILTLVGTLIASAVMTIICVGIYAWTPQYMNITYMTLTPDLGFRLPFTYPRWLDILAAALWTGYLVMMTCNDTTAPKRSQVSRYSFSAGLIVAAGFLPTVGRGILVHFVVFAVIGWALALLDGDQKAIKHGVIPGYIAGVAVVTGLASIGLGLAGLLFGAGLIFTITVRFICRDFMLRQNEAGLSQPPPTNA